MAQDYTIPLGKPGIASFESETYGNAAEMLFGDTPAQASIVKSCTASGAIDWPLLTAVNVAADGTITKAVIASGSSNMTHLTAAPIVMANAQVMDVPLYVAGHYRMQAITFDATFNTDALKVKGSASAPMILISKAKYVDDAFPV